MQIVSLGDNLHEMSKLICWEKNKENISKSYLVKFLLRMQSFDIVLAKSGDDKLMNVSLQSDQFSLGSLFITKRINSLFM